MLYFVYDLIDPRNNQPFYVGITNNPNLRMMQHLLRSDYNKGKETKIKEIQADGLTPKMHILEVVEDRSTALKRETYWIQDRQANGFQLTNIRKLDVTNIISTEDTNEEEVLEVDISEEIIAILSKFDCFGEGGLFVIATPDTTDLPTSNEEKRQMFLDCAYRLASPRVGKCNDRFFNLAFLEYNSGLIEVCCPICSRVLGNLSSITTPKALATMRNDVFHHQCAEYVCDMKGRKKRTDERVYSIFEAI